MKIQSKTVTTKEYTITIQGDGELDRLINQLNNVLPYVSGLTGYTELRYLRSQLRNMRDPSYTSFELPEPGPVVEFSGDDATGVITGQ